MSFQAVIFLALFGEAIFRSEMGLGAVVPEVCFEDFEQWERVKKSAL